MSQPSGTEVSTPGPAVGAERPGATIEALAARFLVLADDDFAGYSPIYERIARAIAQDDEALSVLVDASPVGRTPILSLAAVHDLVLDGGSSALSDVYAGRSGADPWPLFRSLLLERADEIIHRMRTRSIQTNEVGRSAALLPALDAVRARAHAAGDDRPLALVEIGPSAGLNLHLDRYRVTYRRGGDVVTTIGPAGSPVQLDCELRGPADPPRSGLPVAIARRTGVDLDPVDVTDDADCRWLAACVWPDVPDRPERLAAAIGLARVDPPPLVRGDAVTDLAPLLADLPGEVLPVVVSTWAMAYLGREGRTTLLDSLDELGAERDLALVTAEEPRHTPWVPAVPPSVTSCGDADGDGTTTLLGLRTWRAGTTHDEALALCHPHVRWLAWVPGPEEAS